MALRIHNTLTRSVEELQPAVPGQVRMYTCGPTVYNFAHIGNFRAYLFEDLLRRYIKFYSRYMPHTHLYGCRVTQVMNLTDVDDKTIRASREQGLPLRRSRRNISRRSSQTWRRCGSNARSIIRRRPIMYRK